MYLVKNENNPPAQNGQVQGQNQTRMYLDLASQGYTPYHKYRSVAGGDSQGLLKPIGALSQDERAAKIQMWVAHLHHASDGGSQSVFLLSRAWAWPCIAACAHGKQPFIYILAAALHDFLRTS